MALFACLACGGRSHREAPEVEDGGGGLDAGRAIDATGCPDDDGDGHAALSCGGDDCDDGAGMVHPGAPEEDWVVDVVDSDLRADHAVSLSVDVHGTAHLAYVRRRFIDGREVSPGVQYATNASGGWVTEPTHSAGGSCVSLDLGAGGAARIAQCWSPGGFEGGAVDYVTNDGGDWVSRTLATTPHIGVFGASLVVDSNDATHVVFSIAGGSIDDSRELQHATDASGAWTLEGVDSLGVAPTAAVDLDGTLHVAYRRGGELRYATNRSGAWVIEVAGDSASFRPSLALDADGAVHVVHPRRLVVGEAGAELRHVTNAGGAWASEIVDADAGMHASLAVDAERTAHVGYSAPDGLRYATNGSGAWVSEVVADEPSTSTSLALGGGAVHIGFESSGWLLYARRPLPNGIDDDCDGLVW